jgi:dipeptidyl aminopeptidase/acylaminoacyl peptidase
MRRQLLVLVLVVVLLVSGVFAFFYMRVEGKRPIKPEDIYRLRDPYMPVLSENGELLAYQVTQKYENGSYRYVGISSTDGGFEWLSEGPSDYGDPAPLWSPDSRKILYSSDGEISIAEVNGREVITRGLGVNGTMLQWSPSGERIAYLSEGQLFLLDLGTGETEQLTSIPGAIISYAWSPESGRIAFSDLSNVYLWDGKGIKQLTDSKEMDVVIDWSPDEDYVCFMRVYGTEADIRIVTPSGEEKQLTDQPGAETPLGWSPDGEMIVYNYHDVIALQWPEVWVVDLNGNRRQLASELDNPSWLPLWSSNNKIYFRAVSEGTADVYEVSMNDSFRRITEGERSPIASLTMDAKNNTIAYKSGNINRPTELYVYDLEKETKRQVTHLNDDFLREIELLEPVEFWFDASDGTPIQGWYLKPKGEEKHPLILEAHGGPYGAWSNTLQISDGFDFQLLAANGYGVAWINPRGSWGYGRDFVEAIRGAWGISDSQDFLDATDFLSREGWVDEDRLGFTGLSYGGYMTNWMITHTDRFKAAVSEAGIANLTRRYSTILNNFGDASALDWSFFGSPAESPEIYERCSPVTYVKNVTTPTLFIHGVKDLNVAIEDSEEMVKGITDNTDTSVALIRYPDEYHGIGTKGKNYVDRTYRMINWFDSYLMDGV